MLLIDLYLITGCVAVAIYFTYRRIEQRQRPVRWQNSSGGTHALFFQKWQDQFHRKSPEAEENDELFDVSTPVTDEVPTWVRVYQVERETFVQMNALCDTDIVKVETGEMIPVKGVVVEGSAWVLIQHDSLDFHFTPGDIPVNVQQFTVGDLVVAQKIVVVGSLKIRPDLSG